MRTLRDRVAVVTGGADGIGLALAHSLLKEGARLVVADVNEAALARALEELAPNGEVIAKLTDVSRLGDVEALRDAALDRFGAVHVLVNNAGVGGFQRFETTSTETWEWIVGVDLWGPIYGMKAFLPVLKAQDEAHILNTASMAAFMYGPFNHPYNVAKAGVVAVSESLKRELDMTGATHVGVSVLCPAYVSTKIVDDELNAPESHTRRDAADPELRMVRERLNRSVTERGIAPADVARLCIAGILDDRFYIFTHPEWLKNVSARAAAIVDGQGSLAVLGEG